MTTKIDLKKELKHLYHPSPKEAVVIEVPHMRFLTIDGYGSPNDSEIFSTSVEALYSLAYTIKFALKKGGIHPDYTVMPLEGLWWTDDMREFSVDNKDIWKWTLMIMQPEFVTETDFQNAVEQVLTKRKLARVQDVRFETFDEGNAAQIMHLGPFSEEGPTVQRLHSFIREKGYNLRDKHHEIYLSDPRKAAPEKMKTVIRQPIQ